MYKLVLIRHGESTWNQENRFTGWTDVDLNEKGLREAKAAGELLKKEGYSFDRSFVSVLKRALRTNWMILDELNQLWIPIERSWRLNERHYGSLQGLNKGETAAKFGDDQVLIWRRSYDVPPPALEKSDERWPGHDPRYKDVPKAQLPLTECLKDTVDRVLPYWHEEIAPAVSRGEKVLVTAHGNTLRAMVKYLDNLSEEEVLALNIPTGILSFMSWMKISNRSVTTTLVMPRRLQPRQRLSLPKESLRNNAHADSGRLPDQQHLSDRGYFSQCESLHLEKSYGCTNCGHLGSEPDFCG